MSLKQDLIVVNEFSVPLPNGKGSRGGTPGKYVTRYMAREQATESLAPIQRLRTDDFIMRYMAREDAVEDVTTHNRGEVKDEMRQAQGNGGVAFGYGSVSLSDQQLRAASRDIQKAFEGGKTVLKTVVSFDEDYLKRHGIVDQDFHCRERGDYRGQIDQMKLRMAVMHGMNRMSAGSSGFDDLRFVATIQVDTRHVHCHIAAADFGRGHITKDGTQRGKLLPRHISRLRRGIDAWLDENQKVAQLSSAVGYERRNVTTYIKRWAHDRIRQESLPQFLLSCLPEDRTLWRAGSNDQRMRKANDLVTELVSQQLDRPDSPMPAAMERVTVYANQRREQENLSARQWQGLVDTGRSQIVERAVNGVYQLLRSLPEEELRVRTPMLEVMGMDYEQMAVEAADQRERFGEQDDDIVSFGFRLRSYSSRLNHHKERSEINRDLSRQWESAEKASVAPESSRPLYEFYRFEAEYHRRVAAKYRHFLPFLGDVGQWYEQQQEVAEYGQRILALEALRGDASLQRMKDGDAAEKLGRTIYDQPGGRLLTEGKTGRAIIDKRIAAMKKTYEDKVVALREDLSTSGLVLEATRGDMSSEDQDTDEQGFMVPDRSDDDTVSPGDALEITTGKTYEFDDTKGLDLHHLDYDFVSDVAVGHRVREGFVEAARERRRLLLGAMDYLDRSGQSEAIQDLPVDDVAAMVRAADGLDAQEPVLRSRIAELRHEREEIEDERRSPATSLDAGLALQVRRQVDAAVTGADDQVEPMTEPHQLGA